MKVGNGRSDQKTTRAHIFAEVAFKFLVCISYLLLLKGAGKILANRSPGGDHGYSFHS
jgi:hypothetical protein